MINDNNNLSNILSPTGTKISRIHHKIRMIFKKTVQTPKIPTTTAQVPAVITKSNMTERIKLPI